MELSILVIDCYVTSHPGLCSLKQKESLIISMVSVGQEFGSISANSSVSGSLLNLQSAGGDSGVISKCCQKLEIPASYHAEHQWMLDSEQGGYGPASDNPKGADVAMCNISF